MMWVLVKGCFFVWCPTRNVNSTLPSSGISRQLIVVDYISISDLVRRRRDSVAKAWVLQPTKCGMAYVVNAISDVFCVSVCPCSKSTASQSPTSIPALTNESLMTAGRAKLLPSTNKSQFMKRRHPSPVTRLVGWGLTALSEQIGYIML